jgi:Tol biopolymer transport system component
MALVLAIGACATSSSNAGNVRPEQGIEQLTHPRFSYPTWTPDGARILYESAVTGSWEIWMMDVQGLTAGGGTLTRITSNDHLDRMPAISPDGSSIVFISDRDGDYEVFRMNVDGSRPVQLTFNDLAEIHPYWSPDGRKIIYNRRVEGRRLYEIRMMDPDGSNDVRVLQVDPIRRKSALEKSSSAP